jgi:hypothetical protein
VAEVCPNLIEIRENYAVEYLSAISYWGYNCGCTAGFDDLVKHS